MNKRFDEKRNVFKPYGFTCEMWVPSLMHKPDRHNEIEINYFPEKGITYLFQGRKIEMPANRFTLFWALTPHQIVGFESTNPYYVCTVPFAVFLEWKLAPSFLERILSGQIIAETDPSYSNFDEFNFKLWLRDFEERKNPKIALLEIQARVNRMASEFVPDASASISASPIKESNQVEKIAMFIAQNYNEPIKVSDIGQAMGLHPDHANSIFKKTFGTTLSEYLTEERISQAQRELLTSDLPITKLAFNCGFQSISRFNAAFLKITGCTPREFRKRN
ncbi:helix-turn-helix domain-containing protein [Algoriphagus halophytocola]|uniref:Helix-turn-helix domain-containing protein n=1 Tax=Algoriphagus halophytocola TaxID=2991499 RepID=A0ABY6MDL3_9BACT|nr:helix-turn-helix domain-containing protein [Algoriphagus sp. TR-M5]UZD21825.1 helix-turn-helix domain-containing protein [Algoriphagus sp. TR-M5]